MEAKAEICCTSSVSLFPGIVCSEAACCSIGSSLGWCWAEGASLDNAMRSRGPPIPRAGTLFPFCTLSWTPVHSMMYPPPQPHWPPHAFSGARNMQIANCASAPFHVIKQRSKSIMHVRKHAWQAATLQSPCFTKTRRDILERHTCAGKIYTCWVRTWSPTSGMHDRTGHRDSCLRTRVQLQFIRDSDTRHRLGPATSVLLAFPAILYQKDADGAHGHQPKRHEEPQSVFKALYESKRRQSGTT